MTYSVKGEGEFVAQQAVSELNTDKPDPVDEPGQNLGALASVVTVTLPDGVKELTVSVSAVGIQITW